MHEAFRQRLSADEAAQYDLYDGRASLFSHLVVWPGIAGVICYAAGQTTGAIICLASVLIATPLMIMMGRRAKHLRNVAEQRFLAIMDAESGSAQFDQDRTARG